jgi:RND family efflux transporter MFP subunit
MVFKRLSFYLALLGIIGGVLLVKRLRVKPPPPPPLAEPSRSPFSNSVAATGIIEATRENVRVAPSRAGLVTKVFVRVGSKVKVGDPLFQLDDREARARAALARSQLDSLRAALQLEQAQTADIADQFERVARLAKDDVASTDELKRKEFLLNTWKKRIEKAEADVKAAERQLEAAQVDLDILTVRAPRDGTLLQVNLREGEYASAASAEPLMLLGDVDKLQVRADVDEQNAPLVTSNQPAVAFLKGSTQDPLPLRFVRIEPYVIPKRSLTGDSAERVDTRVLQVIFELDRPPIPLYVGQQVDVFIQRAASDLAARPASVTATP